MSSAKNLISRGASGDDTTVSIPFSTTISSGFRRAVVLGTSNPSSSPITISLALLAVTAGGPGGCAARVLQSACASVRRTATKFRNKLISSSEPSCFDWTSPRRNGLRRSKSLRSPYCSTSHGQSRDKKTSRDESWIWLASMRPSTLTNAHQCEAANVVSSNVIYTSHCRTVVWLFFKVA